MQTPDLTTLPPLIRALLDNPACYDHAIDRPRLIETHISWVLLTGQFAYKIKKPVNMGFLDFSTLVKREHACADEIRLNRRLAPETYLDVQPITGSAESPHIGGQGAAFEYAVRMRQFQHDATLDSLAEQGLLGPQQIDALAVRLAEFHLHGCPAVAADSSYGDPDEILQPVADNFRILSEYSRDPSLLPRLTRLEKWSRDEHIRLVPLMRSRKLQGKVRECHGDLHLGNLAWSNGQLIIFDCIEFSASLRCIDVISEVAFCYMDLIHRHHRDLAFRFLNTWLEATGDYQGMALLRYYAVYRAMVRAKVTALRASQSLALPGDLMEWLQLAEQLAQEASPQLWITHGLSGCGKTTLSQSLLQQHGLIRLRSDVERKRLAGIAAGDASNSGIASGLYAPDGTHRTYAHLAVLAEELLAQNWPVIIDAACLARWQRDMFRESARCLGVPFRIFDIMVDLATLRARISRRRALGNDASEANLLVLQHQIDTENCLAPDELCDVIQTQGEQIDRLS